MDFIQLFHCRKEPGVDHGLMKIAQTDKIRFIGLVQAIFPLLAASLPFFLLVMAMNQNCDTLIDVSSPFPLPLSLLPPLLFSEEDVLKP